MSTLSWHEANQQHLVQELHRIYHLIFQAVEPSSSQIIPASPNEFTWSHSTPPALESLASLFQLSNFEKDILLLCAAMELDSRFPELVSRMNINEHYGYPCFSLALAILPNPHWSAITPSAPLRRWKLVEIGPGNDLVYRPIRIRERLLHYLIGFSYVDEQIQSYLRKFESNEELPSRYSTLVDNVVKDLTDSKYRRSIPAIYLTQMSLKDAKLVAWHICLSLQLKLHVTDEQRLPIDFEELDKFIRLWECEAALIGSALFINHLAAENKDFVTHNAISWFINHTPGILIVAADNISEDIEREWIEIRNPTIKDDNISPVINTQDIVRAIHEQLPYESGEAINLLTSILVNALENGSSETKYGQEIANCLKLLAGSTVSTQSSLIKFGKENNIGEVLIGDIAGRNVTKIQLNFFPVAKSKTRNFGRLARRLHQRNKNRPRS